MSIRMTRRRAAVVAVGAVVVGTVAVLPALPASAATACSVTYKIVNQWSNGFQGGVTLKNTGDAWTSWTLTFSFANGQTVSQGWSGKWAQSSANVTVTNETWNGSVANGASWTWASRPTCPAPRTRRRRRSPSTAWSAAARRRPRRPR
ncbi:cellulose binding domain-containing protein [Luedemannella flava]